MISSMDQTCWLIPAAMAGVTVLSFGRKFSLIWRRRLLNRSLKRFQDVVNGRSFFCPKLFNSSASFNPDVPDVLPGRCQISFGQKANRGEGC